MSDRTRHIDLAVIGLGLAGATLAWKAYDLGLEILIVDDADADAASRVAAGLMTPVTGGKLKPQPGFSELAGPAIEHYERVAERTGVRAYSARPALRFLTERRELDALCAIEATGNGLIEPFKGSLPDGICADGVPVLMPGAGRLAIADYVGSTRRYFAERGAVVGATLSDESVVPKADSVEIGPLGSSAAHAVFCRGYRDNDNSHFPALRWRAAKGQILELDCPGFDGARTVHGSGMWLTASDETTVLAGATYEWDTLDATLTTAARDKLEAGVRELIDLPYTVVGQRAAVRPIVAGRMPVIGRSSGSPRIWLMNGLGSKGTLFAPTVAADLLAAINDDQAIRETWSLNRRVVASG